jgi:hypothetical protein
MLTGTELMSQYTAPNRAIEARNGSTYAYRRFGKSETHPWHGPL